MFISLNSVRIYVRTWIRTERTRHSDSAMNAIDRFTAPTGVIFHASSDAIDRCHQAWANLLDDGVVDTLGSGDATSGVCTSFPSAPRRACLYSFDVASAADRHQG